MEQLGFDRGGGRTFEVAKINYAFFSKIRENANILEFKHECAQFPRTFIFICRGISGISFFPTDYFSRRHEIQTQEMVQQLHAFE